MRVSRFKQAKIDVGDPPTPDEAFASSLLFREGFIHSWTFPDSRLGSMAEQQQIDQVRANLGDTDSVWFDDIALGSYLDSNGGSVARATGAAIRNMALVATMTGRSIRADDLSIDSRQRGKDLNEIAQSWFDQADAEDGAAASDIFDIVPFGGRTYCPPAYAEGQPDIVPDPDNPGYARLV